MLGNFHLHGFFEGQGPLYIPRGVERSKFGNIALSQRYHLFTGFHKIDVIGKISTAQEPDARPHTAGRVLLLERILAKNVRAYLTFNVCFVLGIGLETFECMMKCVSSSPASFFCLWPLCCWAWQIAFFNFFVNTFQKYLSHIIQKIFCGYCFLIYTVLWTICIG